MREVHLGVGCRKVSMAARFADVTCVSEGPALRRVEPRINSSLNEKNLSFFY